jgi:5-methylcytosine-specific restriction endonuclease McrA
MECANPADPKSKHSARCQEHEKIRNRKRNDRAYRAAPRYGRCVDCGAVGRCEVDHVVPLWAGGTNAPANLQLLCRDCHRKKGKARGA